MKKFDAEQTKKMKIVFGTAAAFTITLLGATYVIKHTELGSDLTEAFISKVAKWHVDTHGYEFYMVRVFGKDVPESTRATLNKIYDEAFEIIMKGPEVSK